MLTHLSDDNFCCRVGETLFLPNFPQFFPECENAFYLKFHKINVFTLGNDTSKIWALFAVDFCYLKQPNSF